MIICSCNVISDNDIRAAISKIRKRTPDTMLTPGKVYKQLGKRAQCGTCLQNAIEIIISQSEDVSETAA